MEFILENSENVRPNPQTTNGKVTHINFSVPDLIKSKYDEAIESADSIIYDIDRALSGFTIQPSQKRILSKSRAPVVERKNVKAAPLKIDFNRSTPNIHLVESPKRTPASDKSSKSNALKSGKKIISLAGLSAKERLELRAKRFGIALPGEAKKVAGIHKLMWSTSSQTKNVGTIGRFTWTSNSTPSKYRIVKPPVAKIDELKQKAAKLKGSMASLVTKIESQVKLEKKKAMFGAGSGCNGFSQSEKPHLRPKRNSL